MSAQIDFGRILAFEPHVHDATRLARAVRQFYLERQPGYWLEEMDGEVYDEVMFTLLEKLDQATKAIAQAFTDATDGSSPNVVPIKG